MRRPIDRPGGRSRSAPVAGPRLAAVPALILTAGALGDRLGAKRVFIGGFTVFALASLGCALAPSLVMLIAARIIQGVGAAILVPCSLALVILWPIVHTEFAAKVHSGLTAKMHSLPPG